MSKTITGIIPTPKILLPNLSGKKDLFVTVNKPFGDEKIIINLGEVEPMNWEREDDAGL